MSKDWPRLSKTLSKARRYEFCQSCDKGAEQTWQECDEDDIPEIIYLRLCKTCADKIIEPHPRLYIRLDEWAPAPGAMRCCIDCGNLKQGELDCRSPLLKSLGGPGLPIQQFVQSRGIMCSRGKGGGCRPFVTYSREPECKGKVPLTESPPAD